MSVDRLVRHVLHGEEPEEQPTPHKKTKAAKPRKPRKSEARPKLEVSVRVEERTERRKKITVTSESLAKLLQELEVLPSDLSPRSFTITPSDDECGIDIEWNEITHGEYEQKVGRA